MNEGILFTFLLIASNVLVYMMGRFSSVNNAINKQWGDQKEFNEWKQSQENKKSTK